MSYQTLPADVRRIIFSRDIPTGSSLDVQSYHQLEREYMQLCRSPVRQDEIIQYLNKGPSKFVLMDSYGIWTFSYLQNRYQGMVYTIHESRGDYNYTKSHHDYTGDFMELLKGVRYDIDLNSKYFILQNRLGCTSRQSGYALGYIHQELQNVYREKYDKNNVLKILELHAYLSAHMDLITDDQSTITLSLPMSVENFDEEEGAVYDSLLEDIDEYYKEIIGKLQ